MSDSRAYKRFLATYARGYGMVSQSAKLWCHLNDVEEEITLEQYNKLPFISECGRSGIVATVAAFDDYFTSRFSECVTPILKCEGPTDGLIVLLAEAGMDLKAALELLHMKRPHRRIRSLIDSHFSEYTTQKFHVIDELYSAIGLPDICENAQKKAKRKNLKISVQHLIRRRHLIVHSGDTDRHNKLRKVDPKDTMKRMQNMKALVKNIEDIVVNRMKRCK